MSKTATTPPKPATTPAKAKRQGASAPKKQAAAKSAPKRQPTPTKQQPVTRTQLGSKVGEGLQKEPRGNPARSQVGSKKNPAPTQLGSKGKTRTTKEPSPVKASAKPGAQALPKLDPAGFQRVSTATLTLTATVQHGQEPAESPGTGYPASAAPGPLAAAGAAPGKLAREPTELERRFAFEYVQDGNGMRAYMRATRTTHEGTAATASWRLLNKPEVRAVIDAERLELQRRIGFTNEDLLKRLVQMVLADARELVDHIVESCRYCHGFEHEYQRTDIEFERDRREFDSFGRQRIGGQYLSPRSAKAKARAARIGDEEVFEVQGGTGFVPSAPPHPDCPQCHGHGQPKTIFKDTRLLSPGAAMLYAGAEESKDGFRFKMHNQVDLMEKLAKHLGLYDADNRQRASNPLTDLIAAISGPRAALPITENPDA